MLEVIDAGLYSTVQDAGRVGYGHLGVRRAGAADVLALAAANLLAGNAADAPAVEMTLLGGTFVARVEVLVGIAGADMGAHQPETGRRLSPGGSYLLRSGSSVAFGAATDGARTYLAVGGGVVAQSALGSSATDPIAGFGGIEGRPIRAGDALDVGMSGGRVERRWPAGMRGSGIVAGPGPVTLAVVAGPHHEMLPAASVAAFAEGPWAVSPRCDRVGLRLEGEPLSGVADIDLVSMPMLPGAIQVPAGGRPIVLMPDAPTVGGYPVPAVVIEAERDRTGQLRPGDELRFSFIDLAEARRRRAAHLELLRDAEAALA